MKYLQSGIPLSIFFIVCEKTIFYLYSDVCFVRNKSSEVAIYDTKTLFFVSMILMARSRSPYQHE